MNTAAPTSPVQTKENLNEVLLLWTSPSYPFKKRGKIFFQTVAAFTFLLMIIVFFLHEFLLMGAILSIAFVVYVISTVPPVEVKHKITPLGFENAGRMFRWIEMASFWFEEKWGQKVLVIQTRLAFPSQLRAVLKDIPEDKIKEIVGKYLFHLEKPPKSLTDNLSDWLTRKIPLETTT